MLRLLALTLALLIGACAKPAEVRPALWLVEGPQGQKAWLFGTIHALPRPVDWRSARIDQALSQSDRLVLEVADVGNDAATAQVFASLAQDSTPAPLAQRAGPDLADDLAQELRSEEIPPASLDRYETWAAALMIAQAQARGENQDSANGIDRALARDYRGPIAELEGARVQLSIFDALPEVQQRALLAAVIADSREQRSAKSKALENAWMTGNLEAIIRATDEQMFADPQLREALLVGRNRTWADKLTAMLGTGARPFVAVGAAHMVGPEGLPALLAERGFKVTRLQ